MTSKRINARDGANTSATIGAIIGVCALTLVGISLSCRSSPQPVHEAKTQAQRDHEWALELRESYARPPAEWPAPAYMAQAPYRELGLVPKPAPTSDPAVSAKVALGRALTARPGILCLDEPLSALDDETRGEMYELLEKVQQATGVTTLHVTHNLHEAEQLADRILLLRNGKVECQK